MAGHLRLLTLFTLLVSTSAVFAQSGRPWVDPPTQDGAQPQTSVPAATPDTALTSAVESKPVSAAPSQAPGADNEQAGKSSESLQPQGPSSASPVNSAIKNQASQKSVAERMGRLPSRKAAASSKTSSRNGLVASKRGLSTSGSIAVTRREGRIAAAPRSTRLGRVQSGPGSRLEVMSLRTIEFPDGRRITILTKPSPGAMSEMARPPGY